MATQFRLAALGHTMETGRVVEWHVTEGNSIEEGQPLVSVETDKTVVEVNSPIAGTVLRLVGDIDKEYQVGDTLAWIGDANEDIPVQNEDESLLTAPTEVSNRVTPVAARLAERHGIDASRLTGTGPDGRVTKDDVRQAIDSGTPTDKSSLSDTTGVQIIPLIGIRRTTAQRLSTNWSAAPHVTEGMEIDVSELITLRQDNKETWLANEDLIPSINDFVLKAVSITLASHRQLNSALIENQVHQYEEIHLGVAVEVDAGLVVPTIRDAGTRSLLDIASSVKQLASRAQAGELTPKELGGATFTITNLGHLGIDWFTPVLNPPQCGILGVGRARQAAVVRQGRVVARDVMTLALTFDHRIIDGAPCARFLRDLQEQLESPSQLLDS